MRTVSCYLIVCLLVVIILYSAIGTGTRVDRIKQMAPKAMAERHWTILRYEGYQYGSWGCHGGKVWYHVCNTDNPNIQYRIYITLWSGELQFTYGAPEVLNRFQVNLDK